MVSENILAFLRIRFPDESERVIPITKTPFSIGRTETNDLQLVGEQVSRQHARLLFEGDRISLIDLNSSNGTRVEGVRIPSNQPYPLAYGTSFTISDYTIHLDAARTRTTEEKPQARPFIHQAEASPRTAPLPSPPSSQTGPAAPVRLGVTAAPPPPPAEPPPPPPPEDSRPPYDTHFGLALDRSRYLQYLPPIYEEHPFLDAFLLAFEGILTPIEQSVDNFDLYLHPHTAPAFFLEQLAAWLALTLDEKWPIEKRRAVLAEAAELYRRRGTRWSLSRHLEIYSGITPEIYEPDDQPHLFSVVLRIPSGQAIDRATVERIIQASKPAHTVYTLEIFQDKEAAHR